MRIKTIGVLAVPFILILTGPVRTARLAACGPADRTILMLHFLDGEVTFRDDGTGPGAFTHYHENDNDTVKTYGVPLNTAAAGTPASWVIRSAGDANYGASGARPAACYRKSKLNGMAENQWSTADNDYTYEHTMEHFIYLRLPHALVPGSTYVLEMDDTLNSDAAADTFTWDIFSSRSEALHINLAGYHPDPAVKAADLYLWMGDGGARDYSGFEGNGVYLYDVNSGASHTVGTVSFWQNEASEAQWYHLIRSNVWNTDFSAFSGTGTYRLAVEGIGCSPDFRIAEDIHHDPFKVSVKGFFYMRIGQDSSNAVRPVPRRPLWLPGTDPAGTVVLRTHMDPYHAQWSSFSSGDVWDKPDDWKPFIKTGSSANPRAWGGHSDALDWDRHLGHVSIIYDMLFPFILTRGAIDDDNLGIAESGNGIPDILDEARYEVDFWLRLRDGAGYSHGLTNPNRGDSLFQADATPMAAWANAAGCAMLAECFRLSGHPDLMAAYRDSAIAAYLHAGAYADPMPDVTLNVGDNEIRGRDLKMTAAAYLYNVTGDTAYETVINDESVCTGTTAELNRYAQWNQVWGTAAYLLTGHPVNFPVLQAHMKASIIYQAKRKEADYSTTRPSRRASDNNTGYFQTAQNVHRTMLAHAVADNQTDKDHFRRALVLEADWGLGRNPLNMIQMTTAATALAGKRSVENLYTSGGDDGTPGMHPGHTPYMNVDDWACGMVMGCPSWLHTKGYPADFDTWPKAEAYFNTRYVWAHGEFTPQQTMRGKTALYGYLYGIDKPGTTIRDAPDYQGLNGPETKSALVLGSAVLELPGPGTYRIRLMDISGRTRWSSTEKLSGSRVLSGIIHGSTGCLVLTATGNGATVSRVILTIH